MRLLGCPYSFPDAVPNPVTGPSTPWLVPTALVCAVLDVTVALSGALLESGAWTLGSNPRIGVLWCTDGANGAVGTIPDATSPIGMTARLPRALPKPCRTSRCAAAGGFEVL